MKGLFWDMGLSLFRGGSLSGFLGLFVGEHEHARLRVEADSLQLFGFSQNKDPLTLYHEIHTNSR